MKINEYGAVILTVEELFESIYANKLKTFENVYTDLQTVEQFNTAKNANKDTVNPLSTYKNPNLNINEFDKANQESWFMPEQYKTIDISKWLLDQCATQSQYSRVNQELDLFIQHNMMDLLKYIKYLVDTMREQKIVWGVGRGSSVASYCLFLIGIHKIDSLKYNLDINEFLK